MKKIKVAGIVLIVHLICFGYSAFAQIKPNDFSVVLNEEMVNKVFNALGEIKGSNDYEVMLIKGKYHWTIRNPKILIRPDSSQFNCDATVEVGPFSYSTPVFGDVKITYDNKLDEIQVKITRAIFELYTMLFGKKIHIKDIDLADYFKDPFAFEGPRSASTDFEFMMPDSTIKKIYVNPSHCEMIIRHAEIVTNCEMNVSDKAPVKSIKKPVPDKNATLPKKENTSSTKK